MDSIPLRTCFRCKKDYPQTAEYFTIDKRRKDGLTNRCRSCDREYHNQYYDTHKEKHLASGRKYRENNREKVRAAEKRRYYKNHDHMLIMKAKWRENNREKVNDITKKHYWKDAEKSRRRARVVHSTRRMLGGTPDYTGDDIKMLYETQKGRCWWCGRKLDNKYHIDHRIPLAKGGADKLTNLCIACPDCNHRKYSKMPWEFNGRLL